jgi:hypothetical protein
MQTEANTTKKAGEIEPASQYTPCIGQLFREMRRIGQVIQNRIWIPNERKDFQSTVFLLPNRIFGKK